MSKEPIDIMNDLTKGNSLKFIIIGAVLVFLIFALNPFVKVPAGHRGVVENFGAVSDKILGEGLHFRVPIMQNIVKMDVQIQKSRTAANAATKDLQNTKFEIVLNYRVAVDEVNTVYQKIGIDYVARVIEPNVQEAVKSIAARYTAEQLITERQAVSQEILVVLKEGLKQYNIIVDNFSIVDFEFSAQFTEAIEQKQTAKQLALKAEQDLDRIKTEAKQTIEQAKAEAMSLKLKRVQITPQLIELSKVEAELKAIEKWDGKLPVYTGGPMPFVNVDK